MEIVKDVKITRFASGDRESGRIVITDKNLAPLVRKDKRYRCKIIIEEAV